MKLFSKYGFLFLIFFSGNSLWAVNPLKEYWVTPEEYQLKYKSFNLKTSDGYKIKTWYIQAPDSISKKINIIVSYGNMGNMSNWLNLAASLTKEGFNVWLYDYRGFGESSDFKMNPNQLYYPEFLLDLTAVVDMSKKTNPNYKTCLMGMSTGSIISMMYLQKNQKNINYYIGESHIYSPDIVAKRIHDEEEKPVTLPETDYNWISLYKNLTIPFMICQCSDDSICLVKDLIELWKEMPYIKINFFRGDHLQGFYLSRDEYIKKIKQFLSE